MASDPGITGNPWNQAFEEQVKFFQQKVRLPTKKWTDLWKGMHARAFVVAGAVRDDMLADFQGALLKAMEKGTGIKEFRETFDDIVKRYGWVHNGSPGWRSKVIFETNMRTAYMAGRYKQLTDPDMLKYAPYWVYKHGDSKVPRPEHLAWDGLVLRADDPWWKTHYPPNGWGCTCKVFSRSEGDLKRMGLKVDQAPEDVMVEKTVGSGPDSRTMEVPAGIDPGWDYNVGEADTGRKLSLDEWNSGPEGWETLTPGNWETEALPEKIPLSEPKAELGHKLLDRQDEMEPYLKEILGGDSKTYFFEAENFQYPVLVDAKNLGDHVDPGRARFLPFLEETITDPTEVWMAFERSRKTGKVALRFRFIKGHDIGQGKGKAVIVVADANEGNLQGWTVIPTSQKSYINNQRKGKFIRKKSP